MTRLLPASKIQANPSEPCVSYDPNGPKKEMEILEALQTRRLDLVRLEPLLKWMLEYYFPIGEAYFQVLRLVYQSVISWLKQPFLETAILGQTLVDLPSELNDLR